MSETFIFALQSLVTIMVLWLVFLTYAVAVQDAQLSDLEEKLDQRDADREGDATTEPKP